MRGGANYSRGPRDGRNDRRHSERDIRNERSERNHGDRQYSNGPARPPYNGKGNTNFDRGYRGRSAAPITAEKEPASRPPPAYTDKPSTPERRRDQIREDYDRRMPAQDIREFRSNVRLSLSDSRKLSTSSHPNQTPTKPIELLAPENILESIDIQEKDFVVFTGGVNLNLTGQQKKYVDVDFGNMIDGVKEERLELIWLLDGLIEIINPNKRLPDIITPEDVLNEVVECSSAMEKTEADSVLSHYETVIEGEISRWLNALFFASCCAAGYLASDFLLDDFPSFKDLPKNVESELETALEFAELLVKTKLFHTNKIAENVEEIRKLAILVKEKKTEELAKKNVTFALTAPLDRLRFGISVTEDEIYRIIDASVSEDCAHYLWFVDHCPEKLLHSARIANSIINGIILNRLSKDQRLQRAFFMIMPAILASLSEEELSELAEKHMKKETKLANWSEMMYKGYLMSLEDTRKRSKETDIVLIKLLEAESPDDLKNFLLSCALIAEFDPQRCPRSHDNSLDSFCTRMARVLIDSGISPLKRTLLLEALMLLPKPVKDQLLAREGFKVEHSLYHSVRSICTEMSKLSPADVRKWGSLVVRELSKVLSPVRILSFAVLPCLKTPEVRIRAAALLPELLSCEELHRELLEEREGLSPAVLAKTALEQYEEPGGTGPQARYALIEEILKTVDVVLAGDVSQKIIDDVDVVFEEKKLSWQQHYSILHICLPQSHKKLQKTKIPTLEFSTNGLQTFNITAILQSWPSPDAIRGVFDHVFSDIFSSSEDLVLVSYVILSAAVADNSKIKDHFAFLGGFLRKKGELLSKNKKEATGDGQDEKEEQETWLSKELSASGVSAELRRTVLRIAELSQKYSQEADRLQKIFFPSEKSVSQKISSKDAEGTCNISARSDLDENSNKIVSVEVGPALGSSSQKEKEADRSSIISSIDYEGERFPEVFKSAVQDSHDSFNRCVLWLNEDLARTSGDFVEYVKSSKFQSIRMHRMVFYLGGRRPDIEANRGRKPLPNAHLPLYLEIQARPAGMETEERLRDAVKCVKTALDEYVIGVFRPRRNSQNQNSSSDSRSEHHRYVGRGGRQRGRGEGRSQPVRRQEERRDRGGRGAGRFEKKVFLNGISDETYDQNLDLSKIDNLRRELDCGIDIIGYHKDWRNAQIKRERPIVVKIWARNEEKMENAERRIKGIFHL